jgi:beta-lactamase regulating signal transducer with metallopeptidase domain
MTTLALKAILAMAIALLLVVALRRARASVRHLVLAALFGFLLLLPVVERFAPRWEILVKDTPVMKRVVSRNASVMDAVSPATRRQDAGGRAAWNAALRVYAAGAALLLAWLAIGVLRLRRMETRAEVWLEGTGRMNEIAHEANIRRPALVVVSEDVDVPMTFGFRRSTIILPADAKQWPAEELTLALRHELEHVRRDDWFLQLVARAACALYWPVPLVWMAWQRFCLEAERACDDAVVGCAEPEVYAGQLVSLARSVRGMTTVPALGMAKRSRLGERIRAILDPSQRRGPHSSVATAAALAVVLALLVSVAPARLIAKATHDPDEGEGKYGRWKRLGEALTEAAEAGRMDIVRHYLDAGIDVNTVAEGDGTALIGAARGGQLEMSQFLIERGADVNLLSRGDGNPLIAAAGSGSVEIVRLLLDEGADIGAVVPGDEDALITASAQGRAEVVRLLIERGADVNASVRADDNEIRTALRMARRGQHHDVEQILLDAGARD